MILFLFIWWNFTDKEFPIKQAESLERPIFFVGTNTGCPHCKGLPEMLMEFSETVGSKSKVIFTNINCGKTRFCKKHGFRGVPFFGLVRGTNQRYWGKTYASKPNEWASYLSSTIGSIAEQTNGLGERQFNQLQTGGTHFYLQINNSSPNLLKHFQHISAMYRGYDCTFSFSLADVSETKLTAVFSHLCQKSIIIYSPSQIEFFVQQNLRSNFHHYDYAELEEEMKTRPVVLYVVDDFRNGQTPYSLKVLFGNSCNNVSYGWAAANLDTWVLESTKMEKQGESFIVGFNKAKGCMKITTQRAEDAIKDRFIESLLQGENCQSIGKPEEMVRKQQKQNIVYIGSGIGLLGFLYFAYILRCSNAHKHE